MLPGLDRFSDEHPAQGSLGEVRVLLADQFRLVFRVSFWIIELFQSKAVWRLRNIFNDT